MVHMICMCSDPNEDGKVIALCGVDRTGKEETDAPLTCRACKYLADKLCPVCGLAPDE